MKDLTPKEKAKELYSKYYNRIEHTLSEEYSPHEIDVVKQCALIAVDEIMDAISNVLPYGMQYLSAIDYYEEVKQKIKKL